MSDLHRIERVALTYRQLVGRCSIAQGLSSLLCDNLKREGCGSGSELKREGIYIDM